jgi:hypothetical protein
MSRLKVIFFESDTLFSQDNPTEGMAMQIGEIERTETEVVRVSTEEYKGRKYVDVRIYFANDEGEWKPTKKGVTIQPEKIDLFLDLIKKAKESL